jgi:predicted metal-binding membrane protein
VTAIRRTDALVVAALTGVAAAAWLSVWVVGASPGSRWFDHQSVAAGGSVLPFLMAWVVMTLAMMLPTTLPLVLAFRSLIGDRPAWPVLIALLIGSYVVVWVSFGVIALGSDQLVHATVRAVPFLSAYPQLVAAAVLVGAGLGQLAPITRACLDRCRSPRAVLLAGWHGQTPAREAAMIGLRHGLLCLGCCWPLMLTMFAVGAGSLGWMIAFATLMFAEKVTPWGRRLGRPIALGLILAGIFAAAS